MSVDVTGRDAQHKGITWRQDRRGRPWWWDEDSQKWRHAKPGRDAPPLPPAWEAAGVGTAKPAVERKPLASPYRVIPIVIAVVIVVLGLYEAAKPGHASSAQIAAAEALQGQCLERSGGSSADPSYSTTAVSCSDPHAAVKVVAVILQSATGSAKACPPVQGVQALVDTSVVDGPIECLVPVKASASATPTTVAGMSDAKS